MSPVVYLLLILSPAIAVVRGWLFSLTWGWFVVPTFAGAPELPLVEAIGISFIIGMLTANLNQVERDETATEGAIRLTVISVGFYLFAFITALVIHAFQ